MDNLTVEISLSYMKQTSRSLGAWPSEKKTRSGFFYCNKLCLNLY